MAKYLLIIGGSIFLLAGLSHGIHFIRDVYQHQNRALIPMDPALIDQMASTGVRGTLGQMNMWDAWLGFNISHSLGAVMFGLVCVGAGIFLRPLALPKPALLAPVLVGVIYFWLAVRFWFVYPAIGLAIGTVLLFLGWLTYSKSS